ncbi:NAD(P)/FAD-dependent oxidoreductase [Fodinicurvata sediminis]|uniref:NAD(P)/FAD-dependent oxidoreductase n=1 Tax=Fodinicurvata sediminis TaxID=1121832 RepID=UPI0003B6DCE0|nr:FAD-dependent oxidoreductase [Fodinicurvata sediminis]
MTIDSERPVLANSTWTATSNPTPDTPPLSEDLQCDVTVVGGGFTGLSTAIHLAEKGVSVTVLEAEHPGWGASGRNGGQVIPGLKEDPDTIEALFGREMGGRMVQLAGRAPDLVFDLIEKYGIECGAVREGWIQSAHNSDAIKACQERAEQWQRRGADIEPLSKQLVYELLGSEAYHGGLIDRRGGGVHPLNYTLGLARAAISQGVRLFGQSRVISLDRQSDGFLIRTSLGSVRSGKVVLATNAYTPALTGRLRRSVVPACSVQVATAPLSENVRRSILPYGQVASDTRKLLVYYRLDQDGRFLIGGRGAYGDGGIKAQMARLRNRACHLYPQLGEPEWEHQWGGFVAMTKDHFPHLHEIEPGLIAGLGFNGRGVAMATAMGRVLADKASGTANEDLNFPITPVRTIPFYFLRKPAVSALAAWYALVDRV